MAKKASSIALKAIKLAMVAETKARQLYTVAASKTTNLQGREMFRQLANFEKGHYNRLKELQRSLSKNKEYIYYPGQPFGFKIKGEVEGHIEKHAETVIDILIMAIGAERNAKKFYKQLAKKIKDPAGKQMFEQFAREEDMHFRVLSDQFYNLTNKGRWGD